MRYVVAYVLGGVVMFTLVNEFVYPLPTWIMHLHGITLGLFAAAVFIMGSVIACGITWVVSK